MTNNTIESIKHTVKSGHYTSHFMSNRFNNDTSYWNDKDMKVTFDGEKSRGKNVHLNHISNLCKRFEKLTKDIEDIERGYVLSKEELKRGGKDIYGQWVHKFKNYKSFKNDMKMELYELEWRIENQMNYFYKWY